MPSAFKIGPSDNVATLLEDTGPGPVRLLGQTAGEVVAIGPIALGHKIALGAIEAGAIVRKYGVAIGQASRAIDVGEWVHLHNCQSRYDARSNEFDVDTGAAKDTRYD